MNKYTFEYTNVIEAKSEEEAMNKFEQDIVDQINDGELTDSIVDWFTVKKLHS